MDKIGEKWLCKFNIEGQGHYLGSRPNFQESRWSQRINWRNCNDFYNSIQATHEEKIGMVEWLSCSPSTQAARVRFRYEICYFCTKLINCIIHQFFFINILFYIYFHLYWFILYLFIYLFIFLLVILFLLIAIIMYL